MYNVLLPYGSRAFGKTITVINRSVPLLLCTNLSLTSSSRSEVVGRPLAALLANDGARVFSVDLDGIQEFSRRKPAPEGTARPSFLPHHVVQSTKMTLEECLAVSDAVVSGVSYLFSRDHTGRSDAESRYRVRITKSRRTVSRKESSPSTLARTRTLNLPSRRRYVSNLSPSMQNIDEVVCIGIPLLSWTGRGYHRDAPTQLDSLDGVQCAADVRGDLEGGRGSLR